MKKYTLTKEHEAMLPAWRDKWIANAMSTEAMTNEDREIARRAIYGIYESAGLKAPTIVFVPSPLVGSFAAGFAAAIWHIHDRGNLNPEAATGDATEAATRAATGDATEAATWDATGDATEAATWDATGAATWAATWDATGAATWDATRAATWDATEAATWAATRAATRDATGDATEAATWDATRAATEAATGDATRDDKSWWVFQEMPVIRLAPMFLRECAKLSYRIYQGGNQWSYSDSFYSFFDRVVNLNLPIYEKWRHWERASLHSGPRWVHEKFCIISDRPERLLVDSRNRPHCDDGPFCRWRDGSALYAIRGVRVPSWIIETPEKITPQAISAEDNAEVRRVMTQKYGWHNYLDQVQAKLVDKDDDPTIGELYRWREPDGVDVQILRCLNGTPDNGKEKWYSLRTELRFNRAIDANRHSYPSCRNLSDDEFREWNKHRT